MITDEYSPAILVIGREKAEKALIVSIRSTGIRTSGEYEGLRQYLLEQ